MKMESRHGRSEGKSVWTKRAEEGGATKRGRGAREERERREIWGGKRQGRYPEEDTDQYTIWGKEGHNRTVKVKRALARELCTPGL